MGAALGSIMASTIAAHIAATSAKPLAAQVSPAPNVGWHSAAMTPSIRTVTSARYVQPSAVNAMTQATATSFGRANAAPSRPAPGGKWLKS